MASRDRKERSGHDCGPLHGRARWHEPGDFWTSYFSEDVSAKLIPEGGRWLLVLDPQRSHLALFRINAPLAGAVLPAYEMMDDADRER